MQQLTIGETAERTGWSARMLRYLEDQGLMRPQRTEAGYRIYDPRDVERLESLRRLRGLFRFGLDDLAFALRLRREPYLRAALNAWLEPVVEEAWLDWEQAKHQRLLSA